MAATRSSAKKLDKIGAGPARQVRSLISRLSNDYPQFSFCESAKEHWSPRAKTIYFNPSDTPEKIRFGILHELAHALLGHSSYGSDFELVKLESEAWVLAEKIGRKYKVTIGNDYIQNCLDTYRDWLHRRSTCPSCGTHVLQKDSESYECYNCQASWHVSSGRFVRPYRLKA